uniref:Uncharacterized protein n=1 Tax=Rhizophora mucronata TaxID=61149 RepID=A0A2P2N266_RHIMU
MRSQTLFDINIGTPGPRDCLFCAISIKVLYHSLLLLSLKFVV